MNRGVSFAIYIGYLQAYGFYSRSQLYYLIVAEQLEYISYMINQKKQHINYNNGQLQVQPAQSHLHAICNFVHTLQTHHQQQFIRLLKYLRSPLTINHEVTLVETPQVLGAALQQVIKDQYVIMQDYNEYLFSYKGVISCMVLGTSNSCYLIDCISLWDEMHRLSQIFQNPKIVKLVYNAGVSFQNIKRDFHIFPFNHFELKCLENYHPELRAEESNGLISANKSLWAYLKANQNQLMSRPLSENRYLLTLIKNQYCALTTYAKKIGAMIETDSNLENINEYSTDKMVKEYCGGPSETLHASITNLYNFLLKPYTYAEHQQLVKNTECQKQIIETYMELENRQDIELTEKQRQLYYLIFDYRQHLSRMANVNPYRLFPTSLMLSLCKLIPGSIDENQNSSQFTSYNGCPVSVPSIQQLLRNHKNIPTSYFQVWEVSLQICSLIELNQEMYEEKLRLNSEVFNKINISSANRASSNYTNEKGGINIKKLLADIEWGNGSEWLNRKDDPSIKMYKEIVSIDEFDSSITQEFIDKLSKDVLSMKTIAKYHRYAYYMRNKKYGELEKYYKQVQDSEQLKMADNMEEIDSDDNDFKDEKQLEELKKKSTKHTVESLNQEGTDNKQIQAFNSMTSLQENTKTRKSSESSSIKISELDEMVISRADIKPLPSNLQQIYEMAQEVKKKAAKKVNRKKEKKENKQANNDKEFVPTMNDIECVLNAQNNLK